jgi:hypothetical protein
VAQVIAWGQREHTASSRPGTELQGREDVVTLQIRVGGRAQHRSSCPPSGSGRVAWRRTHPCRRPFDHRSAARSVAAPTRVMKISSPRLLLRWLDPESDGRMRHRFGAVPRRPLSSPCGVRTCSGVRHRTRARPFARPLTLELRARSDTFLFPVGEEDVSALCRSGPKGVPDIGDCGPLFERLPVVRRMRGVYKVLLYGEAPLVSRACACIACNSIFFEGELPALRATSGLEAVMSDVVGCWFESA